MINKALISAGLLLLLQTSCINTPAGKETRGGSVKSSDATELNGAIVKNDIQIEARGVKVKQVYLMNSQQQELKKNETNVGSPIYLTIELDTGWSKHNGLSFIGASEQIKMVRTSTIVVDAKDLFDKYTQSGIDPKASQLINIIANITNSPSASEDFSVSFHVWDKNGPGDIKGSYRFTAIK